MTAFYKLQGKTLLDVMNDIYSEFGYYSNTVSNYQFEGAAGMEKMAEIMENLRANTPKDFAGKKVVSVSDYKTSIKTNLETLETEKIELPKSNVLAYKLEGGAGVIVRPSGTEPKIKTYITAIGKDMAEADKNGSELIKSAAKYMEA